MIHEICRKTTGSTFVNSSKLVRTVSKGKNHDENPCYFHRTGTNPELHKINKHSTRKYDLKKKKGNMHTYSQGWFTNLLQLCPSTFALQ